MFRKSSRRTFARWTEFLKNKNRSKSPKRILQSLRENDEREQGADNDWKMVVLFGSPAALTDAGGRPVALRRRLSPGLPLSEFLFFCLHCITAASQACQKDLFLVPFYYII